MAEGTRVGVWAEESDTGKRRDLTLEEHQPFWTWAAVRCRATQLSVLMS
jgi:hypothetical protein